MKTDNYGCKVGAYEPPLFKVEQAGREWIINTSSPMFAGAQPQPPVPEIITLNFGFIKRPE